MKTHLTPHRMSYSLMNLVKRFRTLLLVVAILTLPLFSVAYAEWFPSMLQAGPETVAIFQGDCTTPATSFTLGDTVCAKLTNAPTGSRATQVLRRLALVGPDGFIRVKADVPGLDSSDDIIFTIPATETSAIGGETIDNRGTWHATSFSGADGSTQVQAAFTVTSNVAVAQLSLLSVVSDGEIAAGENVTFTFYLQNRGPDPAADVVFTAADPANTTFVSNASSDPNLACANDTGTTTCTLDSLATNAAIKFSLTYNVGAGTAVKTIITIEGSVTTTTAQRSTRANSTESGTFVLEPAAPGTCTLTCPADVIATADTTQGTQFGAFVKFAAAGVNGDCGAVSNSPASGSFFAVGTHTITSSGEGGGSCTFTVKVLGTPAPTISCPANKFVSAAAGADDAPVSVGTPTFNASGGGTVVGVRSDATPAVFDEDGVLITPAVDKPLTDPYPVGVTGILWTVTDADGRTATCRQTVTVNASGCENDTINPTITAPNDISVVTGPSNGGCTISLDDELGQAETSDNSTCPVTVTVTGIPAGNQFGPGTYTLTYTATDAAGNTATDTQTVSVTDTTRPVIEAPADATYTCPSEVPAANPNQATRGDVFDEQGNLLPPGPPFDNCGVPVVTVTETNNGGAGSATNPLIITRTFRATDAGGLFSEDVQTITVADGTAPTLNVPADITVFLPLNSTATSMPVTFTPTASDNCSGAVTIVSAPASGSTFNVGTTTVNVTATDAAGNQTTGSFSVTVLYNFTGFFAPVDNMPTLNVVNAGKGIPVKFSLSGNKGLSIFAASYPISIPMNCESGSTESEVEETLNAGQSSLSYDSASDQYVYVWKSQNSWAGTCRQLVVKLNDGTEHRANFKFR